MILHVLYVYPFLNVMLSIMLYMESKIIQLLKKKNMTLTTEESKYLYQNQFTYTQ